MIKTQGVYLLLNSYAWFKRFYPGLCRVLRVVGYPTIALGTRTQISVHVPEMLHYGKI